jgi:hypothetical protein
MVCQLNNNCKENAVLLDPPQGAPQGPPQEPSQGPVQGTTPDVALRVTPHRKSRADTTVARSVNRSVGGIAVGGRARA